MPRQALRTLVGHQRTRRANRQLGLMLAFVAGAINAGGFLAIQRYTSHMTGIVSGVADDLALGHAGLALAGALLVAVFISGAITTTVLIHWARRRRLHSEFALSLLLEALLLLAFGLVGANLAHTSALLVPAAAALLCFIMGLQNAMVTKISQSEVRTTHMTGVVTDLGIELGKLLYWNRLPDSPAEPMVRANRDRMRLHASLLASFAGGGLAGALAFQWLSFFATVPIALLLAGLAAVPILDDLQAARAG
ncbi:MAG: YoaK family protein [Aquabacterium sp.]|nr:YoaK family protein [Aquabacterium sp.]